MIRWYINKLHVSTPDEEIVADMARRAERGGYHPIVGLAIVVEALNIHHANQAHYNWVMGGH